MNSVCRAQGARVLAQDLKFHGFDVDLVAFYRNELSTLVTPYTEGLNEFWTNRRRTAPGWGNDSLAFNQKPHPA